MGILNTDGVTPVPIALDPVTGAMKTDKVSTIGFSPSDIAPRDENAVPVLMATSSVDGTAIPVYVNSDGEVLITT